MFLQDFTSTIKGIISFELEEARWDFAVLMTIKDQQSLLT